MQIKSIIESQKNKEDYSSVSFAAIHKKFIYEAILNLLELQPNEFSKYLKGSKSGGFQHKIFQEYVRLLEKSFPFTIRKYRKTMIVDSLFDDNLKIFDGISTFESIVTGTNSIKNQTQEYYIGGRKSSYVKPYYIGKILSMNNLETKEDYCDRIISYSFSVIKIRDIEPGTKVTVKHLRVPPHYQMGAMVHVNRILKNIMIEVQLEKKTA